VPALFSLVAIVVADSPVPDTVAATTVDDSCRAGESACSLHALQRSASASMSGGRRLGEAVAVGNGIGEGGCARLQNHGAFHTVTLEAQVVQDGKGQLSQPLHLQVIADTGSSAVILASCECRRTGSCGPTGSESRCLEVGVKGATVVARFESGTIQASLSSGRIKLGRAVARLEGGLLLMLDSSKTLREQSKEQGLLFEGVLGLGPARNRSASVESEGDGLPAIASRSFPELAEIGQLSLCFHRDGADGVLRYGSSAVPKRAVALSSVGKAHWALGFGGISIGGSTMPVQFCGGSSTASCTALPDSGTTLMMGPEDQLLTMYDGICDAWPRCREKAQLLSQEKAEVFQALLLRCETWLPEGAGFDELPPLHLHMVGFEGERAALRLPGVAYVVEIPQDSSFACAPAFAPLELSTQDGGAVWILGTPLFYEFRVGFDLQSSPPKVSFSGRSCGSCDSTEMEDEAGPGIRPANYAQEVALLGTSAVVNRAGTASKMKPQRLAVPKRLPSVCGAEKGGTLTL